jgi:hypothetical protein
MAGWRLTIRDGSDVRRELYEDLDGAIAAMRSSAAEIVRRGPLESAQGFREYDAAERVAARLELASNGFLRGREAGIDVMGDGALVPFTGVVRRRKLDGRTPEQAIAAVAEALR